MIFADGNQRVYLYQKHKILEFLNKITSETNLLIAYHGAASGEVAAALILYYLKKKKLKNYYLFNFAELRNKEYIKLTKVVKSKKIDKIIFIEGFGLTDEYAEFNDIAINIDSHFNDKDVIKTVLNPVLAKFVPIPSSSLIVYDLLKDHLPDKFRSLVAISSILDYNSEAARVIIQQQKNIYKKINMIKPYFWACQYNEKMGDYLIEKLLTYRGPNTIINDEILGKRAELFEKKLNSHIKTVQKSFESGPVIFEVKSGIYRLTSPLASKLLELYPEDLIFVVEQFKNTDEVRISVRYKNDEVNIGKICQKLAKTYESTDAIGYKDTASIRTKSENANKIFKRLCQYS